MPSLNPDSMITGFHPAFKVGPFSPAQSAHAPGGPTCLRPGNWSLRFYRCSEHNKIRKYRQRARSLQIQTPPHTSRGRT